MAKFIIKPKSKKNTIVLYTGGFGLIYVTDDCGCMWEEVNDSLWICRNPVSKKMTITTSAKRLPKEACVYEFVKK